MVNVYIYPGITEPEIKRNYQCDKSNCFYCLAFAPQQPKEPVILNPIYASKPGVRKNWNNVDDKIIYDNINLTYIDISKLLPNRSLHAISARLWKLRKKIRTLPDWRIFNTRYQ